MPDPTPDRPAPPLRHSLLNRVQTLAAERPVFLAFCVFLAATLIVVPLSFPFYLTDPDGFGENILSEAHGMLFDLLVIGWFMLWLQRQGDRRLRANRYREEIEDYLGWRSPEAALRIAGNIRRLNRLEHRERLRLTEAYLRGANLAEADLTGADCWGADFQGALFNAAHLDDANLAGARLRSADLERATLARADLRGADLTEADLERAFLERADLRGATLIGADLQFASLPLANAERARMDQANLRGAHLERANLRRASFKGANLHGASLDGADLRGANFDEADLERADFTGALLPQGEDLLALFCGARTMQGAKLQPEVEAELRAVHPHLLGPEEPQQSLA